MTQAHKEKPWLKRGGVWSRELGDWTVEVHTEWRADTHEEVYFLCAYRLWDSPATPYPYYASLDAAFTAGNAILALEATC